MNYYFIRMNVLLIEINWLDLFVLQKGHLQVVEFLVANGAIDFDRALIETTKVHTFLKFFFLKKTSITFVQLCIKKFGLVEKASSCRKIFD